MTDTQRHEYPTTPTFKQRIDRMLVRPNEFNLEWQNPGDFFITSQFHFITVPLNSKELWSCGKGERETGKRVLGYNNCVKLG